MNTMRAYYGSRFSSNMTRTPEGFLICHNVPIARAGWYEYLGEEIGADDQRGKVVQVYRSPEEVFSPGAMASFEGKVLTDEHPPELVTPDNAYRYTKGSVQNVRPGKGEDADLLLADLVVYDEVLIREIEQGKREVSAGYEVRYEPQEDGSFAQTQICGNHVAVVKSGRAGNRVAIKDSKTEPQKGVWKMPKGKITQGLLAAIGLKHFATDAEPEELEAAFKSLYARDEDPEDKKDDDSKKAEDSVTRAEFKAAIDEIKTLIQSRPAKDEDPDPEKTLDDAIAELEKANDDDDEEESHTVPAESMDDDGPVTSPEDRPKDPLPSSDNAYMVAALRQIKPIIAAIPDPAQKKKAVDAALAAFKGKKPSGNTYGRIKPKKATDGHPPAATATDHSQLGRDIAKKYNPHYKDRA